MSVVFWMAKEELPLSKYESLMKLLEHLNTPYIKDVKVGDKTDYQSYKSACGFLDAISETIDRKTTKTLQNSPVLTILTDESTDIVVHHKLCISARVVDPLTLHPKTLFLTDLRITSATGVGIFDAIKTHLASRRINISSVTGLKYYQETVESLFYYFKKLPERCDRMWAVQKVLEQPQLKYREVHQIRWLSFLEAINAIHRTLPSLLTYFEGQGTSDSKAVGLRKRLSEDFFISMNHAMLDILQPIMRLSLYFQKKDVDIGTVQINVESCLNDLKAIREEDPSVTPFQQQLHVDLVSKTYKSHDVKSSKYSFETTKAKLIDRITENVRKRFPDSETMTSMSILGLRPVSFLDDEELSSWGNESLQTLLNHFGQAKSHEFVENNEKKVTNSDPIIDPEETKTEWLLLKKVVKQQAYPRKSTADLWELIATYHRTEFPNLIKLASLALAHPVHTADCERAFSAQNAITTPLRNRLSAENIDSLIRVVIEGSDLKSFDFMSAVNVWKTSKSRHIKL